MVQGKKEHQTVKSKLHPRNKHRERYDFDALIKSCPELAVFVIHNKYKDRSINFFDSESVKALNRALLKHHYGIQHWDIPANYLCPPIPGRADYIHYIADLLGNNKPNAKHSSIRCLDIGVGANCIYPILGFKAYKWSFVGSDIDKGAVDSAQKIIDANSELKDSIEIRHQNNSTHIFKGLIKEGERFDVSFCNPPFHASAKEAQKGTLRKLSNLSGKKTTKASLNFGGKNNELWCEGGEKQFVVNMVEESLQFADSVLWFTTLVSKEANLPSIYNSLKRVNAKKIETINMGQGNKKSRIIAWTFQTFK